MNCKNLQFRSTPLMEKKHQTTITDVAKAAGVAVGTVSRVFNNHSDVNSGIRAQVWDAARALSYRRIRRRSGKTPEPQNMASSGTIAALFFGMEDALVQLPIVSAAIHGIEEALSLQGRSLMLANIPKGDRVPPFLLGNHVAGLILKGPNQGELPKPEQNPLLQHIQRFPHVWLMGRLPNATGDHCNFDTDSAGRIAAEYLYSCGHRRLGFLNPKPGQSQFEKLKSAFLAHALRLKLDTPALLESAAPTGAEWPLPAITSETKVNALAASWAAMPPETRPTALFVPADRTSAQLYSALGRLGIRPGIDVSILSCNNERSIIGNLHPTLATIDVHPDVIGARTVDQLLWRMQHAHEPLSMQLLVEPSLVQGESVSALR
jgi:DNA-binding LacI/PurR family transcriptional regulator